MICKACKLPFSRHSWISGVMVCLEKIGVDPYNFEYSIHNIEKALGE